MAIVFQEFDAQTGITSRVHETETKTVIQKSYDVQPFLEAAAAERAATEGQRWGNGFRKVGTVPMAELATMLRQDGGLDQKRAMEWLKKNPGHVTFSRFLK